MFDCQRAYHPKGIPSKHCFPVPILKCLVYPTMAKAILKDLGLEDGYEAIQRSLNSPADGSDGSLVKPGIYEELDPPTSTIHGILQHLLNVACIDENSWLANLASDANLATVL